MPNAPLTPCRNRLCPELVPKGQGWCAEHRKQHYRQEEANRPKDRKKGYGRRWQKLRRVILARDLYLCQACRRATATDVDHITPKVQGGTDEAENLQSLCHACHSRKTAGETLHKERREQ